MDKRSDGSGDNPDDETFIVKMIRGHKLDKAGDLKFLVEWLGYEKRKYWTWEPENNLRISGDQILDEYYATIGGEDQIFKRLGRIPKTKRTGRSTRRRISSISGEQWTPPPGSWEEYIEIDDCQGDNDGNLIVYLTWKNGQRTKHGTQVIYEKCPQKMLRYYENHIKIIGKEKDGV
ncbi:hypothetical protein HZ326_24095 [Fusarium oxysporum f. sp. albedinis]|nr:hypothetical protein HZ326_24095 [Fusarium oxysporum f. sp. albedinis]KAK2469679.1 hypothetical protein H9L39_18494 [Fusarium oxysporum f. sp. albedinis]